MLGGLWSWLGLAESEDRAKAPSSVAGELQLARANLTEVQRELDAVALGITDARALVARAQAHEDDMRLTLACLQLECHDAYLHPQFADTGAAPAAQAAPSATASADEPGDDADAARRFAAAGRKATDRQLAALQRAVDLLERQCLPEICEQRDTLDLSAFRLTLRLHRLRQDEADARRRLADVEAEFAERRGRYTATEADVEVLVPPILPAAPSTVVAL
jgi:hypothetical protein